MAKRKPASEAVLDHVNHSQAPTGDPSPVDVQDLTRKAQGAVAPWATGGKLSIEFHPTMLEIKEMKTRALEVLDANTVGDGQGNLIIPDEESYEKVWKTYRELIPLRTAADERRLEEGRQAREYVKLVNELGYEVIGAIAEIEAPLKKAILATDAKREAEAVAKALAIEAEQRAAEEARLAKIAAEDDARKAAEQAELKRQQDEIDRQRAEVERQKTEWQRQQDEARAEQQRQLDAQRAAFEREQAEFRAKQAEAQAVIDAETKRINDAKLEAQSRQQAAEQEALREKEKAAAAERAKEAEARRLIELEEAKKQAAAAAVEAAERQRAEDEREAEEERRRLEAIAAEKAAKAPDRQKLRAYTDAIELVVPPAMKTKEGGAVLVKFRSAVSDAIREALVFCGGK